MTQVSLWQIWALEGLNMVVVIQTLVFLASLLGHASLQQCLPQAQSSRPCEFNNEQFPDSLVVEVQDSLGRATVGGAYQKVEGCFHNGVPLYSQETIRREARQAPRMIFPEARPAPAALFLGEGGRWRLAGSQASPIFHFPVFIFSIPGETNSIFNFKFSF